MTSFPLTKLGALTSLISSGSTPLGGSTRYLAKGPVMFVRSQNVKMNCLDLSDVVYIDSGLHEEMKRTHVRSGDVFINITGASIGRVAAFDRKSDKANVNQHVCIIRPKPELLDFRYLTTYLCTPRFQENINRLQRGGTRQALTFDMIANFDIPLPPLPEQRRIAAILDKTDAIRRKREEGIRLTEELLRSTFLEMFGDPATNSKGLEVKPLSEVARVVMGTSPPSESYNDIGDGVPLINGPVEFSEGMLGLSVMTKFTTQPKQLCQKGDLLLCVRGSTTGRTNIAGFDGCIGRGVAAIRAFTCHDFLTYFITQCRKTLFDSGKGSTFPSITQDQLRSLSVLWPSQQAQEHFAAIFRKQRELIERRNSAAIGAECLFSSLVQRAFRGELTNRLGK